MNLHVKDKLKKVRRTWMLRAAAVGTLVALGLMTWAIVDPRPIPVMVSMMIGMGIGSLSFFFFLVAIVIDLYRARMLSRDAAVASSIPPPRPSKAPR
jgi:hypothetical protein